MSRSTVAVGVCDEPPSVEQFMPKTRKTEPKQKAHKPTRRLAAGEATRRLAAGEATRRLAAASVFGIAAMVGPQSVAHAETKIAVDWGKLILQADSWVRGASETHNKDADPKESADAFRLAEPS